MIVLLIALWSLCAIYFTHLLSKKGMKVAATAVTVLYSYVLLWATLIFVIDIADLGFSMTATRESVLHGSAIYHSITGLAAKLFELPMDFLISIIIVSLVVAGSAFAVIFVGGFRASLEIARMVKGAYVKITRSYRVRVHEIQRAHANVMLIKLYCRANC